MVDGSDTLSLGMMEEGVDEVTDESDAVLLGMVEEGADKVIDVAVPIFDPMENRLMA